MSKKNLFLSVVLAVIFVILLSACGKQAETTFDATVLIATEEQVILSETVITSKENVEEVLVETCQKNKIPYTLNSNMFDNFGGIPSGKEDGWILFINDEVAQAGAKFIPMENNFKIEFRYVNYDTVF